MRNGDGPVRDEERGTQELPAGSADVPVSPDGSRHLADNIDGIPELKEAVAHAPRAALAPYLMNYLAATVEYICAKREVKSLSNSAH